MSRNRSSGRRSRHAARACAALAASPTTSTSGCRPSSRRSSIRASRSSSTISALTIPSNAHPLPEGPGAAAREQHFLAAFDLGLQAPPEPLVDGPHRAQVDDLAPVRAEEPLSVEPRLEVVQRAMDQRLLLSEEEARVVSLRFEEPDVS